MFPAVNIRCVRQFFKENNRSRFNKFSRLITTVKDIKGSSEGGSLRKYQQTIEKSKEDCYAIIQSYDKYSNLISRAYPSYNNNALRDFFIVSKAFQMELNKIAISGSSNTGSISGNISSLKYDFWKGKIMEIFNDIDNTSTKNYNQPLLNLLSYCIKSDIVPSDSRSLFLQMIAGYEDFSTNIIHKGYNDLSEACLFGERTYSSLNYLLFNSLSYHDKLVREIFAINGNVEVEKLKRTLIETYNHLGQSQYLSNLIISLKFYTKNKNILLIPVELCTKHNMSQEEITRLLLNSETDKLSNLKDIIFEISVLANDHIISAEQKFNEVKKLIKDIIKTQDSTGLTEMYHNINRGVPDSMYLPVLNNLSSAMFLKELESVDFDIVNNDFSSKFYWKFPFKCYYNYTHRKIQ